MLIFTGVIIVTENLLGFHPKDTAMEGWLNQMTEQKLEATWLHWELLDFKQ